MAKVSVREFKEVSGQENAVKVYFRNYLACQKGTFRKCFPFQSFSDNLQTCGDIENENYENLPNSSFEMFIVFLLEI